MPRWILDECKGHNDDNDPTNPYDDGYHRGATTTDRAGVFVFDLLPPAFKDIVTVLLRAIVHTLLSLAHAHVHPSVSRTSCSSSSSSSSSSLSSSSSSSSSSSAGSHHDVNIAPLGASVATTTAAAAAAGAGAESSTNLHPGSSPPLDVDIIMSVWIARVQSSFAVTDTCDEVRTQIEFYSVLVLLLQCDRVRSIALTRSSSSLSSSTINSNNNASRSTNAPSTTMTTALWFANLLLSLSSQNHVEHRNHGTMVDSLRSLCDGVRYPTFLTILRDCFTNDDIVDGQNRWFHQSTTPSTTTTTTTTIEQQGVGQRREEATRNHPSASSSMAQQGGQDTSMSMSMTHSDDQDATTAMLRRLVQAQPLSDEMARKHQLQKLKSIFF